MCNKWGWQILKWPPLSLPPGTCTPGQSLPLECGQDPHLLQTRRIWQRWWYVTFAIMLHKTVMFVMPAGLSLAGFDEATLLKRAQGRKSWQPARHWGSQSSNLQGPEFCQQPEELESDSFPSQALRLSQSPAQHLDCSLTRTWSGGPS